MIPLFMLCGYRVARFVRFWIKKNSLDSSVIVFRQRYLLLIPWDSCPVLIHLQRRYGYPYCVSYDRSRCISAKSPQSSSDLCIAHLVLTSRTFCVISI